MKKILLLLLTLCICCAVPAAFAEETTTAGFMGTWEAVRFVYGDLVDMDKEMLRENQVTWLLEIKEDGTFHSNNGESETDGTWTEADGVLELKFNEEYIFQAELDGDLLHVVLDTGSGTLQEYYLARPEEP